MENAIIMAAGMETRMRPVTETIPKPLVKVHGVPMVETVIKGLERRKIREIYLGTGYLGDQFSYLTEKYSNIHIIKNTDYETINNISSIYAVKEVLDNGADYLICEADLYVGDGKIFDKKLEHSCYFGKMVSGFSDDWVFEQNSDGRITRVGKGGTNCYNMVGISYFDSRDAKILKEQIEKAYGVSGFETLFWDDVVNRNLDKLDLIVEPVEEGQSHEYDFLTVGSMGHTSSIALGVALQKPNKKIWCIDGDGAMLMHMGAMAVIGANCPSNLIHIVINNGAHETVGGLPTVAAELDLVKMAEACGYPYAVRVKDFEQLNKELQVAKQRNVLTLIEAECAIGARENLGRLTTAALENKENFMKYLKNGI